MSRQLTRAVDKQSPRTRSTPEGMYLHLECGHVLWKGGLRRAPDYTRCQQGPCYRP